MGLWSGRWESNPRPKLEKLAILIVFIRAFRVLRTESTLWAFHTPQF